ncbi:MAG: hypothetical protein MUO77_06330 [Anaerolineales bacterium]|nr:hypothetical protein [Anaerolineales bacterium]
MPNPFLHRKRVFCINSDSHDFACAAAFLALLIVRDNQYRHTDGAVVIALGSVRAGIVSRMISWLMRFLHPVNAPLNASGGFHWMRNILSRSKAKTPISRTPVGARLAQLSVACSWNNL